MRIGVYVGSFNPMHYGHKYVIDYLIQNSIVDKILIIPTGNYWDKKDLICIEHRAKMINFYTNENIIVDTKYSDFQYTYQILDKLNEEEPDNNFYLIIGADNLPKFDLWENYKKILQNKVIVLQRNDVNFEEYIEKYEEKDNFIGINDFKYIDISSTEIRNMIKNKDLNNLAKYMNNNEIEYLLKNNLY